MQRPAVREGRRNGFLGAGRPTCPASPAQPWTRGPLRQHVHCPQDRTSSCPAPAMPNPRSKRPPVTPGAPHSLTWIRLFSGFSGCHWGGTQEVLGCFSRRCEQEAESAILGDKPTADLLSSFFVCLLNPWHPRWGLLASCVRITGELVKNPAFSSLPQTSRTKSCTLTRSPGDSYARSSLRSPI